MILLDIYIRNNEVLSVSQCLYLVKSERVEGSGERIHNGTTDAQKKDWTFLGHYMFSLT